MSDNRRKIFVLDTNVILHDSECINQFGNNDVVIPIFVLEELDRFKKGHESLNYHARNFLRSIDTISDEQLFSKGIDIGQGLGRLVIKLDQEFHRDLGYNFIEDKIDHRILNTAYCLSKKRSRAEVILVTKDVNLRVKAKALGLKSEDYTKDRVANISDLYTGYRFEENVSKILMKKILDSESDIPIAWLKIKKKLLPNEYIVMRNDKNSVLGRFDPECKMITLIKKTTASDIEPRNVEQVFALDALLNPNVKLVTMSGKAGTGKTLLALAAALEQRENYRQIYLARPVVPLSDKDLGYLPGDVHDKLGPYMQPLYDNLGVIQHSPLEQEKKHRKIVKLLEEQNLIISPLAYIRGRSLVDVYFIVDEAQNLTPHEMKTIITRAGQNTKMVFTGDIFQIDHAYLDMYSNGLSCLLQKMQGQKIYTHINLVKGERSALAELASNLL
ncbi:MAG: PhoH family protein [Candidatus Omnitrophica bacterium]|nr:PhoH family protein [Candidatus Omnitrophota bacterium]